MTLTTEAAAAAIAVRFPELRALPVRPLGEGTGHQAFDVGGRYVFRFPKEDDAARHLSIEARVVRWLAPQLCLPVPDFTFVAPSGAVRFVGYVRLPGVPALSAEAGRAPLPGVGHDLGRFLKGLHAADVEAALALGLELDEDPGFEEWRSSALEELALCRELGHLGGSRVEAWRQLLDAPPSSTGLPVRVLHADFAAEHVLIGEDGRPSGVIDWSDAALGDPARDLAGLVHWGGGPLLAECLREYGAVDQGTLTRARYYAACRAVADIAFGQTHGRPEYIVGGLRALSHVEALGLPG